MDSPRHVTLNGPPIDLGNASTMYRSSDSWMDGTWLMGRSIDPPTSSRFLASAHLG